MVKIVIPSAYRESAVTTLDFIPWATLVVPHDQRDGYHRSYPQAEIITLPKGHPAGLGRSRDWIIRESGIGDHVQIDDDNSGCVLLNRPGGNAKKLTGHEFQDLVESCCGVAEEMGKYLFGFSDSANSMRFSPDKPFRLTGNLAGWCMGFRGGSGLHLPTEISWVGTDAWLSLLNAHLHRCLFVDQRFCVLGIRNSNPGGCAAHRSGTREKDAADHMVKCFGDAAEVRTGLARGCSVFPKIPF